MSTHELSYSQYMLATDANFAGRIASALKFGGYVPVGEPGMDMAWKYIEDVAAQPGLAQTYHEAMLADVENPGSSAAVITDEQLGNAVVAVMNSVGA